MIQIFDVVLGLLDGGPAVALALPPVDVVVHLCHAPRLLGDLLADLAVRRYQVRLVHELEPAGFSRAVLLVALLSEVAPFPVPAVPAGLFKVAHFDGRGVGLLQMSRACSQCCSHWCLYYCRVGGGFVLVGIMMCGRLVGCACRVRGRQAGGRPADGEREIQESGIS